MLKLVVSFSVILFASVFTSYAKKNTNVISDSSQLIADRIIKSEVPVLLDFWAQWCAPCRMLNPILEELEKDFEEKALFIKVNVDVHRALAAYFSITTIPAVFIVNKKTVIRKIPGVQSKSVYVKTLNEVIDSVSNLLQKKTNP